MIRARFQVSEVSDVKQRVAVNASAKAGDDDYGKWQTGKVSEKIVMTPVYASGSPKSEIVQFNKSTPSGRIELTVDNPAAWGFYEPGVEYYVDFRPSPPRCTKCHGQGRVYENNAARTYAPCDRCDETGLEPEAQG